MAEDLACVLTVTRSVLSAETHEEKAWPLYVQALSSV